MHPSLRPDGSGAPCKCGSKKGPEKAGTGSWAGEGRMKRRTRLICKEIFGLQMSGLKFFTLGMDIHQDTKAADKNNNQIRRASH